MLYARLFIGQKEYNLLPYIFGFIGLMFYLCRNIFLEAYANIVAFFG